MLVESVFSVVIAVFAVFGIYCIIKMFFGCFYSRVPAAVVLESSDDLDVLKMKVREADAQCLCGKCGIVVLIPESRKNDENIRKYVENRGYICLYYVC